MSRQFKIGLFVTLSVAFSTVFFYGYQVLFTANLQVQKSDTMLYVPTGASFQQVLDSLEQNGMVTDKLSFAFLAKLTGYQEKVKPGAYLVKANSSNKDLIWRLKSGRQTPVKLTFNNIRLKSDLLRMLDYKLEPSYTQLSQILDNEDSCAHYGFNTTTIVCMFIPNTYEIYWNTSASKVVKRMAKEYKSFWTDARKTKAQALGLTPTQVTVLASITEAETKKADEMPVVAGVYKNRLDQGMNLQADPTVVFAVGDFGIKRVYSGHKKNTSPYNTYMWPGLPPGPINLPSVTAIDATLNLQHHNYLYFCAREDFSGYHNFTDNFDQHLKNARIYQQALNKAGIQ